MGFGCHKCKKIFPSGAKLTRHLGRKRPCDPVVLGGGGPHSCPHCGRGYSRPDAVRRHQMSCAAADPALRLDFTVQAVRAELEAQQQAAARAAGAASEAERGSRLNLMAYIVPADCD